MDIENNHIIYSNSLITIQDDNEDRIVILDSDGEFIDYILTENEDWSYGEIIAQFKDKTDFQITRVLESMFDGIRGVVFIENKKRLSRLYNIYGREFVNRVGQYALIINE